jgi:hypothetical protein
MRPPMGDLWGIPFLRFAERKFAAVRGGVDGVKLGNLLLFRPWLPLLLNESSDSDAAIAIAIGDCLLILGKFFDVPTILQPREQKRKESRRLRSHTSQVLVTPFPGLGCGLSLRKTTFALLIMYV